MKLLSNLLVLLLVCCFEFGCSISPVAPVQETSKCCTYEIDSDSVILTWDLPDVLEQDSILYKIQFRKVEDDIWKTLIEKDRACSATVYFDSIGEGKFEFAVRCITLNGDSSQYHKSSDFNALPNGGWYLEWSR